MPALWLRGRLTSLRSVVANRAKRPRAPTLEPRFVVGDIHADQVRSWLCPTSHDRDRFMEMQGKLRTARVATLAIGLITAAVMMPGVEWSVVGVAVLSVAAVLAGGARLERRRRPELWVFFTTVINFQALVAIGAVLTGGPRTPLVCMVAVPIGMVASRFNRRGLIVGVPVSVIIVLATTLGIDPGFVAAHPESVVVPLGLVLCSALYMDTLVSSDVRHRADSTLDDLTGLLNRRSLESRLAEVFQQAALTNQPVSIVMGDLDRFKLVNDKWGHSVGDLVLSQAADAMRRVLRTFELLYRIGGEEFLLVLPGAGEKEALRIADSLRCAVEAADAGGLGVTCSFGVATSRAGDGAFEQLLQASDEALYVAKRTGRNRVECFTSPHSPDSVLVGDRPS
jgi:diguanylate cyclase (GGDEF)-like protein